MSTDTKKSELPIKFVSSETDNKGDNQNNEKEADKSAKCIEMNGNSKKYTKKISTKRSYGQRWLLRLSIASLIIGLLNVSLGIAIFVERKQLPYWLTDCAYSIWYGFFVLATGVAGLEYYRQRSTAKGIIHLLLNSASLVLTIPSLAFYGKVTTHYRKIREGTILVPCKTLHVTSHCNDRYEGLATKLAALYGFLLVSSIAEAFVSCLLCVCSSTFRVFCRKIFLNTDESQVPECSMFNPGAAYPISSLHSAYHEYHIDSTPLKPVKTCEKVAKVQKPVYKHENLALAPNKQVHRFSPQRKRPAFRAMESITESVESAEYENEVTFSTKEEEEKCQRESLLPQTGPAVVNHNT